jgi:hypothetical protein
MWLAVCFVYIAVYMPKGTTSKETAETGSYGNFFFVVKFPKVLCRPSHNEQLTKGWTIRGSNLVGSRIFAHIQTGPGTHPASSAIGTGSFLRVKRLGCGADHPPSSSANVENE